MRGARCRTRCVSGGFVGCYPKGAGFGAVVGRRSGAGRDLYRRYFDAAVELDGPEVGPLIRAAAAHGIFVVLGAIERFGATLYCTVLMIDPAAGLAAIHRKLMPTGTERLIWGFGDGSTIGTAQSTAGRVGAVICWENYMLALRQAMYAQGVELYCAPTADDRPTWIPSMIHIALEGRVFVLTACQAIRVGEYPDWYQEAIGEDPASYLMRGGSAIIAPDGSILAEPVFENEVILDAEIDLAQIARGHLDMDAVGHYSRPDLFELRVDTRRQSPVVFTDSGSIPGVLHRNRDSVLPAATPNGYAAGMPMPKRASVADFFEQLTDVQRPHLEALRELSRAADPEAREELKWNLPVYVRGQNTTLWMLQNFKNHCSLRFPPPFFVTQKAAVEAAGYEAGDGFIKLPYSRALPTELLKTLMAARVEEYTATGAGWNDR